MAWIESHQELARHPKAKKLARLLGVPIPAAVGYLHFLWWWALDFAQDGDLSDYDNADIADALTWDKDPDFLVNCIIEARFIDSNRQIHDWDDYAGKLLEKRKANTKRALKSKELRATNAQTTRSLCEGYGATVPNSTVHNQEYICASDEAQVGENFSEESDTGHDSDKHKSDEQCSVSSVTKKRRQEMFDLFWDAYPKKRSKGQAEKAWSKLIITEDLFTQIIASLNKARESPGWIKDDGQFIPYPATWLNAKGWEDQYSDTPAKVNSSQEEEREIYMPPIMDGGG